MIGGWKPASVVVAVGLTAGAVYIAQFDTASVTQVALHQKASGSRAQLATLEQKQINEPNEAQSSDRMREQLVLEIKEQLRQDLVSIIKEERDQLQQQLVAVIKDQREQLQSQVAAVVQKQQEDIALASAWKWSPSPSAADVFTKKHHIIEPWIGLDPNAGKSSIAEMYAGSKLWSMSPAGSFSYKAPLAQTPQQ